MKEVLCCCRYNFCQWRRNPRIICVFLLVSGYMLSIVRPVSLVAEAVDCHIAPWVFPFVTSEANCVLILMVLYVMLVCDAPFLYKYQKYLIVRTGKTKWIVGQILYVGLVTIVFWLIVLLCSVLFLLPNLEQSLHWGKVLSTLAQTRLGSGFLLCFAIDHKIMIQFAPLEALAIAVGLAILVSFFLGMFILLFNMSKHKNLGTILALTMVMIQHFAYLASGYWVYKISPVSWISMSVVNFEQMKTNMPSISYVLCSLLLICVLLTVLVLETSRKRLVELLG